MSMHSRTPRLSASDPRGLSVRAVDYWRDEEGSPAQPRINRTGFDAAGRAVEQWDPRLWLLQMTDPLATANLTLVHTLRGQVVRSDSVDAGTQVALHGLGNEALLDWDSRASLREVEHDLLLRPVAIFEAGAEEPRRCAERFVFGQPGVGDPTQNQCGQLIRHDDPLGSLLFDAYALGGQCLQTTRHFTLDPVNPDWPEPIDQRQQLLEPGEGATTDWRFGALGHVLEQGDACGNRQGFELTLAGQLRAIHLQLKNQTGSTTPVRDIHYNADGQVVQEMAGNAVLTTLSYRPEDGRLLERRASKATGEVVQHWVYDYDPMGNVLSVEDKALPVRYFANQRIEPISRFCYDSLYQISAASGWEAGAANAGPTAIANYTQHYGYDAGGNLLKLTHVGAQNHGHQLQAARYSNRCLPWRNGVPPDEAEIAAAFDARGNLRLLDQGRLLRWNVRNQLDSVAMVQRESAADDREVYRYDGNGQRGRKIRWLQTNARSVVADVRYLPALEVRTDSGSGEVLHIITVQTGLNRVRVLHWDTARPSGINDHCRYDFGDHMGSMGLELDDGAAIVSREHFYPFGATAWSEEAQVSYRTVRYCAKERDATGLYYYGYRYYLSWLQRWLNPDPAGAIDGHNRYRAMRNSPVTYRDSDGRDPDKVEKKSADRVYHDMSEKKLVHAVQAAGMQPVRNYFAGNTNPEVQNYRREIPVELAKLGATSDSLLNTHQAHVRAAVKTQTSPPSGPVMYHGGEMISAGISTVFGEKFASRVMGPMSDAFNSPVEDPQVLAARRGAVAATINVGGQLLMHSANPGLQLVGAASVAVSKVMVSSEAQTRVQYKQLSAPANVPISATVDVPRASFQTLQQSFATPQRAMLPQQPAGLSSFVQQAFNAGFVQSPPDVVQAVDYRDSKDEEVRRPRRGSNYA